MPRQNRVTPFGVVIADPARGLVYGNRGCLHDDGGRIRRSFDGKRWIACRLRFKGWHRAPLVQPGRFTELFFLDEATSFAAGHRPCALCRREDYVRFTELWEGLHSERGADVIDARLHAERFDARTRSQRHHAASIDGLPDGAFVVRAGDPWLVRGSRLWRWTPAGYDRRVRRPVGSDAVVITPPSLVEILRDDRDPVVPFIHPTAAG
jgi:hypothetical protein